MCRSLRRPFRDLRLANYEPGVKRPGYSRMSRRDKGKPRLLGAISRSNASDIGRPRPQQAALGKKDESGDTVLDLSNAKLAIKPSPEFRLAADEDVRAPLNKGSPIAGPEVR